MVEVDVSEWGTPGTVDEHGNPERTTIFVREMSARQRDEYEASIVTVNGTKTAPNFKDMRAKMVIAACCDADGTQIFRPEDAEFLSAKPSKVLDRICEAARKLNDFSADTPEEELVKN